MRYKHQRRRFALAAALALAFASPASGDDEPFLFKVSNINIVPLTEMVADLKTADVVIVGEQHDNRDHHRAQLEVIRALVAAGAKVAVGLEMFRAEAQPQLDAWVSGRLSDREFFGVYADNWDVSYWPLYRDIFHYAREVRIPLLGLNVSRDVVRQVARGGFDSLDAAQRQELAGISCNVDPKYELLLSRVLGMKEEARLFTQFCEAQVLWDTAMAKRAAEYALAHPDAVVVVLAGNFHAWRHGIARRLGQFGELTHRVILPSSDTSFFRYEVVLEDADYVWWHR